MTTPCLYVARSLSLFLSFSLATSLAAEVASIVLDLKSNFMRRQLSAALDAEARGVRRVERGRHDPHGPPPGLTTPTDTCRNTPTQAGQTLLPGRNDKKKMRENRPFWCRNVSFARTFFGSAVETGQSTPTQPGQTLLPGQTKIAAAANFFIAAETTFFAAETNFFAFLVAV